MWITWLKPTSGQCCHPTITWTSFSSTLPLKKKRAEAMKFEGCFKYFFALLGNYVGVLPTVFITSFTNEREGRRAGMRWDAGGGDEVRKIIDTGWKSQIDVEVSHLSVFLFVATLCHRCSLSICQRPQSNGGWRLSPQSFVSTSVIALTTNGTVRMLCSSHRYIDEDNAKWCRDRRKKLCAWLLIMFTRYIKCVELIYGLFYCIYTRVISAHFIGTIENKIQSVF